MRNGVMSYRRSCGLAPRGATRYKGVRQAVGGDAGAAAGCGRAVAKCRGFSVIDITGKRVALYARHSTAGQERSVPAQLHRLREAARSNGAVAVGEYADEAVTGAILAGRPAVQTLLAHAADGDFEAVLIEDLSRISRDQADVATIHKLLDFHDVALVSVTEGEIGALHIGLQGTMNSIHLKQLSDKVRRGQLAAVRTGHVPGGRVYGYELHRPEGSVTRGLRRIDRKEAVVVRRIFTEAEQRKEIHKIAADLNRDGIPSPRGKKWSTSSIVGDRHRGRGILRQPIYVGRIVFGRVRIVRHPVTGKRIHRPQPQSDWLVTPAPGLAIISQTQWDRVQQIIGKPDSAPPPRRKRPAVHHATPPRYLTTRRTRCASCGGRISTVHSGYLVCRNWKERRGCEQRHLFRREQIIEATLDYLASPRCESDIHTSCEQLVRNAEAATAATHLAIDTVTDLVMRARNEADALAATLTATVGMARVRDQLAITTTDITTLCDSLERLRFTATGTLPVLRSRSIAAAAQTLAAGAVARIRAGTAAPDDDKLLESLVESIHVAFRGPGRQGLEVTPTVAIHEAYRLGLAEVAPALLREPPRRRHRTASPPDRGTA